MSGKLFILSGPSGVGKGTVCKELDLKALKMKMSISMTTRAMRDEDAEGQTYFFVSKDSFEKNIAEGNFLEHACYKGNYYGTPRKQVEAWLEEGSNVLLEIETQGAAQVIQNFPQAVSIFLVPPRIEDLYARLKNRDSESEEEIQKRLEIGRKELALKDQYQYVVVNDKPERAADEIASIVASESELV